MIHKNTHIHFSILILTITICFSNIFTTFSYAETVEPTTEITTEAPSIVNNLCEPSKQLNVTARGAILIDANTGVSLYEKNADEVLYPASITKIMTTLLGCEYGKFDEIVTHSHNAIFGIGYGSSTMGMQEGEKITLKDALLGVMMRSANETSMAVAEHISGSVDAFVDKMNKKAKELGCTNTHFANPHGFHDDNHYTTPRDMSKIAAAAVKNKDFEEIWGTELYTLPATNIYKEPRLLYNKAKILDDESQYYYKYTVGAKTGFHDMALNTLVSCAEKDEIKLISVVMKDMGYNNAYADAKTLFEYGFTQYEDKSVYSASSYESQNINVTQKYNDYDYDIGFVSTTVKADVKIKMPKYIDPSEAIKAEPVLNDKVEAPVKDGDVVGKVNLSYNDEEIGSVDILAASSMDKLSDSKMKKMEFVRKAKEYIQYGIDLFMKNIFIVIPALLIVVALIFIKIKIVNNKKRKRKNKKRSKKVKRKIPSDNTNRSRKTRPDGKKRPHPKNRDELNVNPPRRKRPNPNKRQNNDIGRIDK